MSRHSEWSPFFVFLWMMNACSLLMAGAGDVTLRTEHPQYPGEGAFQTIPQCVEFATSGETNPQDKAIALYLWFLTHQWHLMSPMEWSVPGRVPDSADAGDYETVVFDANRGRFSYGYGLCGTVHAWNEPYWKALGMRARRREFPNHVNSEVFYNDAWHAFDTDMAGLLFRPDGVVAGYDDIRKDPRLAESVKAPLPHYPFAWPADFESMKQGWQQVAARQSWYPMYNSGYAAHPGIVHLRSGESWTRWYDRDHYGGIAKRRFWQNQPGGPFRRWTFFNNGEPFHDGPTANARSEASYCNGEFVYEPDLTSQACREGLTAIQGNVAHRHQSPQLHSADGGACSVTFRHFSPYVICGDPLDDANPMSAEATAGLVITGQCVGHVACEVSADEGQTWSPVALAPPSGESDHTGLFQVDVTEQVKGRYGWHVRFAWTGTAGLDRLKFTTTTQVSQAMYPRLTPNGCDVRYQSQPYGVVAVLPNFGLPEADVGAFEETSLRSDNLEYTPRSPTSRFAYLAIDRQPAQVVFRVTADQPLREVRAAVRYQVPVPPPTGCDFSLQVSTDQGHTWQAMAVADIPADNEFSSGWLDGTADVSTANVASALVRFQMSTPGRRAALIDAQIYGVHQVAAADAVSIEFGWLENEELQTHTTAVAAGATSANLHIPTGSRIRDQYVRIRAGEN